jgi:hypothetical protein
MTSNRTRRPTARLVAPSGVCQRGRLTRSTAFRTGRTPADRFVKRCVAMAHLVRKLGSVGRSRPSNHFDRGESDSYACDNAQAWDENGDCEDEQHESEGPLLKMSQKPLEIDGVFGCLIHQPRQQIRGVSLLLHLRDPACRWAIIGKPPNSAARMDNPARRRAGHRVLWRPRPRSSPCARSP